MSRRAARRIISGHAAGRMNRPLARALNLPRSRFPPVGPVPDALRIQLLGGRSLLPHAPPRRGRQRARHRTWSSARAADAELQRRKQLWLLRDTSDLRGRSEPRRWAVEPMSRAHESSHERITPPRSARGARGHARSCPVRGFLAVADRGPPVIFAGVRPSW